MQGKEMERVLQEKWIEERGGGVRRVRKGNREKGKERRRMRRRDEFCLY